MHCYDPNLNSWLPQPPQNLLPPPSESFSAVYIEKYRKFLIFGGFIPARGDFSDEMHEYDLEGKNWKKIQYRSRKNPCGRAGHAWTCLGADRLYMFGGEAFERKLGDLWLFDRKEDSWREIEINQEGPKIWPCVILLCFLIYSFFFFIIIKKGKKW